MSDSSIALKPVIDEPSNPIPSSSAAPISLGVTANDFRCPSMSLNQRSTNSTPSSSIRFTTSRRPSSLDVDRCLLSTCAMEISFFKHENPRRRGSACVNFASESHVDRSILGPTEFVRTDVLGAAVLVQHAHRLGIRLVHVSTDEVYGDLTEPAREDAPLRPSSPYSASKAGGDLQVLAAVRTFGANASVTRGSNTYGPNQYPEKVLPLFTTNAPDGAFLPLYGDGKQIRDGWHVDD